MVAILSDRLALPAGAQRFTFGEITAEAERAVLERRVCGVATATELAYNNAYCGVIVIRR
jgi:uncharacterized protein